MKRATMILAAAAAAGALAAAGLIAAGDTAAGEYTADAVFWALVIAGTVFLVLRWHRRRATPRPAQPSGVRRRPL